MVDESVVRDRLGALRLNAYRLAGIVQAGRERFIVEEDLFLKAERCLHLCIQAILDIGTHVLAAETLERPAGYEGVVPALGSARILTAELVARLGGIAGLRNILVHDYLAVNHGLLFDDIVSGLPDLEDFASSIEEFLSTGGR